MLWDMCAQPWGGVYKYKDENPLRICIRFIIFTTSRLITHTKDILLNLPWFRNHLLEVSIWNLLVITLSLVDYDAIIPVLGVCFTGNSNNSLGGVSMYYGFIEASSSWVCGKFFREEEWLLMPDNKILAATNSHYALVQWPLFLLANKVCICKGLLISKAMWSLDWRHSSSHQLKSRRNMSGVLTSAMSMAKAFYKNDI